MHIRVNALPGVHEWSTIVPVRLDLERDDRAPVIAATALAVIALVLAALLAGA